MPAYRNGPVSWNVRRHELNTAENPRKAKSNASPALLLNARISQFGTSPRHHAKSRSVGPRTRYRRTAVRGEQNYANECNYVAILASNRNVIQVPLSRSVRFGNVKFKSAFRFPRFSSPTNTVERKVLRAVRSTHPQRRLTTRSTGPIAACRHLGYKSLAQMPAHRNGPVNSNVRRRRFRSVAFTSPNAIQSRGWTLTYVR